MNKLKTDEREEAERPCRGHGNKREGGFGTAAGRCGAGRVRRWRGWDSEWATETVEGTIRCARPQHRAILRGHRRAL